MDYLQLRKQLSPIDLATRADGSYSEFSGLKPALAFCFSVYVKTLERTVDSSLFVSVSSYPARINASFAVGLVESVEGS